MNNLSRSFPWLVLAVASVYLVLMMAPAESSSGQIQLEEFAKIPIADRGRVKPIDTLARTSLMIISNRQTFREWYRIEQGRIVETGKHEELLGRASLYRKLHELQAHS